MKLVSSSFFFLVAYSAWWLLWIIIQTIVLHRLNLNWDVALTDSIVSNLLLAFAGYVIRNIYRYYSPLSSNYLYGIGFIAALSFLCIVLIHFGLHQIFKSDNSYKNFLNDSLPVRSMFILLMIVMMVLMNNLRSFMNEQQQINKRKTDVELLHREVELAKLRQQLQPHFLFNSLNSISALAGSQPTEARKMIQQLSDFLRGTLKRDEHQIVSLDEELQQLQLYLDIEKVRFGHRLQALLSCNDDCRKMNLPSLLLQPVVENAIKFGLYDNTGQVTISVDATCKDMGLIIKVQNPFDKETSVQNSGTGFGLNSINRRLYLLYARNDLLKTEMHENTFITTILIPQNV